MKAVKQIPFRTCKSGEASVWDCEATRVEETDKGLEIEYEGTVEVIPFDRVVGRIGVDIYIYKL